MDEMHSLPHASAPRRRIPRTVVATLVAAAALLVGGTAGASTDTDAPRIASIRATPTSVDVTSDAAHVKVAIRVTDVSGTAAPRVTFRSSSSASITALATATLTSGTVRDGIWTAVTTIPRRATPGRWEVSVHPLRDRAGNEGRFGPPPGIQADVNVIRYSVPSQPTGVTATPADRAAVVRWTAPTSDGGTPITSYRVETYQGSTALPVLQVGASARSATVTGLANGVTYSVRVVAVNAVGPSTPSTSRSVTPNPPSA